MTVPFTTQSLQDALTAKLALNFGTEPGEATDQEMLKACALVPVSYTHLLCTGGSEKNLLTS